jgi:hypothetical protein
MDNESNSVWRHKYKTLEEYYKGEYSSKYYSFTKLEMTIDPDESVYDIEDYPLERQILEFKRCHSSFSYFCQKFVKIGHPIRGLLPFILFDYQKRVIKEYEQHRFNIISKFRQGGLSTVTVLWGLWRGMFRNDETIMLLSKTDREAIVAGEIAKRAMDNFPKWFKPNMADDNKHEKHFADSGSKLLFFTPEAARGRAITYLILDEAAFIKDMDRHWAAIFPTIATGGRCIAISTVNGIGNWYEEIYHGAEEGRNDFNIIDLDYNEHPDYDNKKWFEEMKAQLGLRRFNQEVLRSFLGSGVTMINSEAIARIDKEVKKIECVRKLFPEWNNVDKELAVIRDYEGERPEHGALWIFDDPIDGRDYIIGADCASGNGDECDNNCFSVIDEQTMVQVAEFYSNSIPADRFAKILYQMGLFYNSALIVVENMADGVTVVNKLHNELFYENLYFEDDKPDRPGVKMGNHNRSPILESLENAVNDKAITVKSLRLVNEMKSFIWDPQKRKYMAVKGKHDDAIFALSHAVYVRNQRRRAVPAGGECPAEISAVFKSEIFQQIKDEILKGAPDDWMDPEDRIEMIDEDEGETFDDFWSKHRPKDSLLREFGW